MSKLITCIVPEGISTSTLKKICEKFHLGTADYHFARGVGKSTPLAERHMGEQAEREVLSIAVPKNIADDVFEFLYHETHIDQPHGGIIYMHECNMKLPSSWDMLKI